MYYNFWCTMSNSVFSLILTKKNSWSYNWIFFAVITENTLNNKRSYVWSTIKNYSTYYFYFIKKIIIIRYKLILLSSLSACFNKKVFSIRLNVKRWKISYLCLRHHVMRLCTQNKSKFKEKLEKFDDESNFML